MQSGQVSSASSAPGLNPPSVCALRPMTRQSQDHGLCLTTTRMSCDYLA